MHPVLEKLLKKRGIDNLDDLREDEVQTFEKWDRILSEGEITLEKISLFCENQLRLIDDKWRNLEASTEKNSRLISYRMVYKALRDAINAPKLERESLEKYLNSLLN